MKTRIIFMLLLSWFAYNSASAQTVGEQAPDFTVSTLDGETFTLSEQEGKLVVIYFFGNSCPFCLGSAPDIESDIHQVYMDDEKFEIIGLDTWDGSSSTTSVTSFKESTGVTFDLVVKGGEIATLFGSTYDRLLVVDADGILRHKGTTDVSGNINNAISAIENYLPEMMTTSNPELSGDDLSASILQGHNNNFTLKLTTERARVLKLNLYDLTGKKYTIFNEEMLPRGENSFGINLSHLTRGIYIYQLEADGVIETGKLMVR